MVRYDAGTVNNRLTVCPYHPINDVLGVVALVAVVWLPTPTSTTLVFFQEDECCKTFFHGWCRNIASFHIPSTKSWSMLLANSVLNYSCLQHVHLNSSYVWQVILGQLYVLYLYKPALLVLLNMDYSCRICCLWTSWRVWRGCTPHVLCWLTATVRPLYDRRLVNIPPWLWIRKFQIPPS